jgi:hypothetical protein
VSMSWLQAITAAFACAGVTTNRGVLARVVCDGAANQ